jgi:hypothetical protein
VKWPSFHLYFGDIQKDPNIGLCTWQAKSLWLLMLCHLHEMPLRGQFAFKDGTPMTDAQIAKLCQVRIADFRKIIAELDSNQVLHRHNGAIANRRMLREAQVHENKKKAGQAGAEKRWHNGNTPHSSAGCETIAGNATYSSSSSSSSSSSITE